MKFNTLARHLCRVRDVFYRDTVITGATEIKILHFSYAIVTILNKKVGTHMKKTYLILMGAFLSFNQALFAATTPATTTTPPATTTPQIDAQTLSVAQSGCQKPIGYIPTPAKLICLLTALGVPQENAKAKQMAIIYGVCQGRTLSQQPAGTTLKSYPTLGACLGDPAAITIINSELKTNGYEQVKVVNTQVLGATGQTGSGI